MMFCFGLVYNLANTQPSLGITSSKSKHETLFCQALSIRDVETAVEEDLDSVPAMQSEDFFVESMLDCYSNKIQLIVAMSD